MRRLRAILIGVSHYSTRDALLPLAKSAAAVVKMAELLCDRDRSPVVVNPNDLTIFLPDEAVDERATLKNAPLSLKDDQFKEPTFANLRMVFDKMEDTDSDLFVFWSGHGCRNQYGKRTLLFQESMDHELVGIEVENLILKLRSTQFGSEHSNRLALIEACSSTFDSTEILLERFRTPPTRVPWLPVITSTEQGQAALSGAFSDAVLEEFDQWPASDLLRRLKARLRKGRNTATPMMLLGELEKPTESNPEGSAFVVTQVGKPLVSELSIDLLRGLIAAGKCVPIVGGHWGGSSKRSSRSVAEELATLHGYPFGDRHVLPEVAEFIQLSEDLHSANWETRKYWYPDDRADYITGLDARLLKWLAKIQCSIFLTTRYDELVYNVLEQQGRTPKRLAATERVDSATDPVDALYDESPEDKPDRDRPLVYSIFGRSSDLATVTVTESAINTRLMTLSTENRDTSGLKLLPDAVGIALNQLQLYIGFDLTDRSLRSLARAIAQSKRVNDPQSAAVVIAPYFGEELATDEKATAFVESYLKAHLPVRDKQRVRVLLGDDVEKLLDGIA